MTVPTALMVLLDPRVRRVPRVRLVLLARLARKGQRARLLLRI